mmetsp:Transcript_84175/g.170663  ORF Transcript_84175/g.170663 Transcript_84175/m.170663 type:complete len:232 (+) Transcript_84175:112-807(+)
MSLFLEAFLLALASSTDNFMVGLSVGISNRSLSFGVNALISVCNATGALLAGFGGAVLGQNLPPYVSPLLSGIAFGGLALREFFDFWQTARRKRGLHRKEKETHQPNESKEDASIIITGSEKNLDMIRAMHLAIPMTLNNLAGGVAGGAIGVSPLRAGLYGLIASFLTMALGHWIGRYVANFSRQKYKSSDWENTHNSSFSLFRLLVDPSFAGGSLLGILSLMSLQELMAV